MSTVGRSEADDAGERQAERQRDREREGGREGETRDGETSLIEQAVISPAYA